MELKFNELQTPLTEEVKESLPKEIWNDVLEYISSVKMIQNLISPERGFIADRPVMTYINDDGEEVEYEDGRKQIDITNPHRLENLDYFRERAIFFNKNGRYTNLIPNGNPKSEYALFWKEELRRWKYGLVRDDGEWIPGLLYFYWNYTQIAITEQDSKQKKRSDRIRSFPRPWLGDYLFYHYVDQAQNNGQHCKLLKTRGIGFSFKSAAWSPCNMYTKPGSQNPNFHLASEKTFLSGDKGIWGKVLDNLDWIGEKTPFPRLRLVDKKQAMEVQLGYEDEYGSRQGLLSSAFGISLKDNPDKARGIRGPFIHYEEDGLFPNLEKAWNVNRKAVEDGGVASGTMFAGGTGGVEGASFEGSEKLFYSPGAYNIYGVPNVFDKNTNGETECGFFWGGYMNRNLCYDLETGEPDVIKALIEICTERYKVKYSSSDANAITQKKAEEPITPQEAIMRTEGTVFPVADLKEHLESIAVRKEAFLAEHYVGDLVHNSQGNVEWRLNANSIPLRAYDVVGDRTGAIEIFEMPKKNAEGIIQRGRYIAGVDPIDADEGPSLFSVLVMDTFTDRIVAEYTGRPRRARDAYDSCLKLLKFYNAEANYESNLKGLFSYFDERNCLHYLADTPQILRDMEFIKQTNLYGNRAKGTHLNQFISKFGRQLQADWMLEQVDKDNEEDNRLKLHTLRSLALIEEYIKWNADGNFDRVSAGIMLFILREDRYRRIQGLKEQRTTKIKSLANDPFFSRNWKGESHSKNVNVFEIEGDKVEFTSK